MKKLFLAVLGGKPKGSKIEQHNIAFGIGENLEETFDSLRAQWNIPSVHLDSYMAVEEVDGYRVIVNTAPLSKQNTSALYFINLGGYKENDLEEYHKKLIIAASNLEEAKSLAKKDSFFRTAFINETVAPHVDDKIKLFDTEIDEAIAVADCIASEYSIKLIQDSNARFDNNPRHPTYIRL